MIKITEDLSFERQISRSLVSFSEKICKVSSVEEILLFLNANIPKKLKRGEIIFFYESRQFGLRRAYVREGVFYEEVAQKTWPLVSDIKYSCREEMVYLAQEMGRPFFKAMMIPFSQLDQSALNSQSYPVLFVEILHTSKKESGLKEYFYEIREILDLILNRILLNTSASRISYLWSHVFGKWGEPLAILKNSQVIKSNHPFDQLLKCYPNLLDLKEEQGLFNVNKKIYQIHYYPISQLRDLKDIGIFYCQDMTEHYFLKEKFFQSEKMSAFYELGRNISHELNNPLTGIRSMAQILSQDKNLKEFHEPFKEVENATACSQKIIENLLTFSEQKKQKSSYCYLNKVVKDTLPLVKSMTSGISVQLDASSEDIEVVGSVSALQQVVYNLIINACQALKEFKQQKNPTLIIRIEKTADNQSCLEIKDNGPGIQKEHLEKIFQPLWTTKKQGEGTGLGLGIARQIINQYGGNIQMVSEPYKFTCFSIYLPLKMNKE